MNLKKIISCIGNTFNSIGNALQVIFSIFLISCLYFILNKKNIISLEKMGGITKVDKTLKQKKRITENQLSIDRLDN